MIIKNTWGEIMIEVKEIIPEMTYNLRHSVLRPNQSIDDCKYDTDYKPGSFHIGAFYQEKLISTASFCIELNPNLSSDAQYRLRAMATIDEFRRLGAGRQVVNYAEKIIKEKGVPLIWCKGRTSVQNYYEKIGFHRFGEVFDYPPIGPHIIMFKNLK